MPVIVRRSLTLAALLALFLTAGCVRCSTCPPHTEPAHAELSR